MPLAKRPLSDRHNGIDTLHLRCVRITCSCDVVKLCPQTILSELVLTTTMWPNHALRISRLVWIGGLFFLVAGCATGSRGFPPVQGIANFDEVSPHLYRGAQPNRVGLQYLHKLGIRTIINLRATNDVWMAERDEAAAQGMEYFNLPMSGLWRPKMETVSAVLSIIEKSPAPVFVHCEYGCDRTGTIIACYRIKHEGWNSNKALNEARIFGMARWELWMKCFVDDFEQKHSEARLD